MTKDEEKAAVLSAIFASVFKTRHVVLWVPSLMNWKTETGIRMKAAY